MLCWSGASSRICSPRDVGRRMWDFLHPRTDTCKSGSMLMCSNLYLLKLNQTSGWWLQKGIFYRRPAALGGVLIFTLTSLGCPKNSLIFPLRPPLRSNRQNLLFWWFGWVHPHTMNASPPVKDGLWWLNTHLVAGEGKVCLTYHQGPGHCRVLAPAGLSWSHSTSQTLGSPSTSVFSGRVTLFHLA